jgi:hypothetical protein
MTVPPFPGEFPGTIGAPPDVAALIRAADMVFVVTVEDVVDDGDTSFDVRGEPVLFHRQLADVRVDRAVKGDVPTGLIRVELLLPDIPPSLVTLRPGERAALFLRQGDPYRLVDPVNAKLGTDPDSRAAIESVRDDADHEVAQVARALLRALPDA